MSRGPPSVTQKLLYYPSTVTLGPGYTLGSSTRGGALLGDGLREGGSYSEGAPCPLHSGSEADPCRGSGTRSVHVGRGGFAEEALLGR